MFTLCGRASAAAIVAVLAMSGCFDSASGFLDGPSTPPIPANDGAFNLRATPAAFSVSQGGTQAVEVLVTRTGHFIGVLTLAPGNTPAGITATFAQPRVSPTVTRAVLTIIAGPNSAIGSSTITVTGTGASVSSQSVTIEVTVTAPQVAISPSWSYTITSPFTFK